MSRALCVTVAAALLTACGDVPSGVELVVSADPALTDDALARVAALTVTIGGAQSGSKRYDVSGLRREERLLLRSSLTAGLLDVTVDATTVEGLTIASAKDSVTLSAGRASKAIVLHPESLNVAPLTAAVTQGRTQKFVANLPVTWSVDEPNGGTIDENGFYTAPSTPGGRFHVRATSAANSALVVTADVEVRAYGVELVAGVLGGAGAAPGVGVAARVSSVNNFAVIGTDVYAVDRGVGGIYRIDTAGGGGLSLAYGLPWSIGDLDGVGLESQMTYPVALASDPAGNRLWIGDILAKPRVIDLTSKQVTTLPTTGTFSPGARGLWYDGADSVYMTLTERGVIAKLTVSTNQVAVIAGQAGQNMFADGDAATARFNKPYQIVGDFAGNLYVTDFGNHRIRKIALAPQVTVTTLAGGGAAGCVDDVGTAARFNHPWGISYDGSRLLVADYDNHVIRTVGLNGSVGTLTGTCGTAGSGARLLNHPIAVTSRPAGGGLFIAEESSGTIKLWDGNLSTAFGTVATSGSNDGMGVSARLGIIADVVSDGTRVFIADRANHAVRVLLPDGSITRLVGSYSEAGFVDGDATTARMRTPNSLVWHAPTQRLFIADQESSTIRVWDDRKKTLSTVVGRDQEMGTEDGAVATARLTSANGLAIDDAGEKLYFNDVYGGAVRRIDLVAGQVSTIAGSATDYGAVDGPLGTSLMYDAYATIWLGGLLWVGDGATLRSWDPTTGILSTRAGVAQRAGVTDGVGTAARFRHITRFAATLEGKLLVAENGGLRSVDLATMKVTTIAGGVERTVIEVGALPGALNFPSGVAVLEGGDLILGDFLESALIRVRYPVSQ